MIKRAIKFIDDFLNRITMYRLVLYFLFFLVLVSLVLGLLGLVSVKPLALLLSTAFLLFACWLLNNIFSHFFGNRVVFGVFFQRFNKIIEVITLPFQIHLF